jgi:hypothetical protein
MLTLNMETDVADKALTELIKCFDILCETQKTIIGKINSDLRESKNWVSSSAKEFYDEYDELDKQLLSRIEEMGLLRKKLDVEIYQWKQADTFGSSAYPH